MAIPIEDFATPRFIKYKEGATLSRDDNARFDAMPYGGSNTRAWRQAPQPGYNAQYPSTTLFRPNFRNAGVTYPPQAR